MPIARRLRDLVVAACALYVLLFVSVAARRFAHPFELEWMEGGMLTHAARIKDGLPVYAPPSADFVAFFYPPGYPAVVAWLSKLTGGVTFAGGRAVSFGATLATMAMLFDIVRRETSWRYGVVAAGLYAACFRFCGAFFDLARPDALAMAVILAAAYVARFARSPVHAAAAALLFVAAYFTKQTSSVIAVACAIPLFLRDRKLAIIYAATGAVVGGAGVLAATRATDGWFWFYVAKGHQGHLFYWKNFLLEYWRDALFLGGGLLLVPLAALSYRWRPIAIAFALLLAAAFVQRATTLDYEPHMYYRELWYESPRALVLVPPLAMAALLATVRARATPARIEPFWIWTFAAGALASALNHSTQWAYANCFMPLAVFGSIAVALALHAFVEAEDASPVTALVPAALAIQLVAFAYDPRKQAPDARDAAALATLKKRTDDIAGKILAPAHPLFSYARDGKTHLHQMGVADVAFQGGVVDLTARLARREWGGVILDEGAELPGLDGPYFLSDKLTYDDAQALFPRTGHHLRPLWLWRQNDGAPRDLAPGITGNFEPGPLTGWSAEGLGFGPSARRPDLPGFEGRFAATTRNTNEGPSTLTSAPFVLDKPRLTFLLAGTSSASVRVLSDGRELSRVQASDAAHLQPRAIDLRDFVGKTIVVAIVDDTKAAERTARSGVTADDLRTSF